MDRLYVCYEKYRRMIAEKKILHRLVQGVRILTVALACYGWWGVIYPELTMLPSTYEIVYEETEATEAETVQTGPEVDVSSFCLYSTSAEVILISSIPTNT